MSNSKINNWEPISKPGTQLLEPWPEPTYYISPDGSDSNKGTTPQKPWKTFEHALPKLKPGDVLGLMDGVYEQGQNKTGLLHIKDEENINNGTPQKPITVRAINERLAFLKSDGTTRAVEVNNCKYWNLLGLRAEGADHPSGNTYERKLALNIHPHVVLVHNSEHIKLKRMLACYSNRAGNNHLYWISNSSNILTEECEGYYHHRHAFGSWQSENLTYRRNYMHTRHYPQEGRKRAATGDEAYAFYRSSYSLMENNIAEGDNYGFHTHGGLTYTGKKGGSYNRFLGNIALNIFHASRTDARKNPYDSVQPAVDNYWKDFLAVNVTSMGLWASSGTNTICENVTLHRAGTGFQADSRDNPPAEELKKEGWECSFTLRNALAFENKNYGINSSGQHKWLVEYSNSYGNGSDWPTEEGTNNKNIKNSISTRPSGMGLDNGQAIVFVPEESNMKGAGKDGQDIGANVIYRYIDGKLTDIPLWDPQTGEFPHGAVIPGVNDIPGKSAFDVHKRLNVNCRGCKLPYSR